MINYNEIVALYTKDEKQINVHADKYVAYQAPERSC